MTTITVEIDDTKAAMLWKKAESFGILPDEFITATIEDLLNQPDQTFEDTMQKVISKNKELYKRLA